jgi:hypothetical protein
VKVELKLSLPPDGTVWVIVRVNVPEAATLPLPLKNVWKLPKLEPVGVFKLVDPKPVNVIIRALPMPPKKVTELLPLPAHPAQVKVPDVEKVTGSAFAVEAPKAIRPASRAVIRDVFRKRAMFVVPFVYRLRHCRTSNRIGDLDTAKRRPDYDRRHGTRFMVYASPPAGQTPVVRHAKKAFEVLKS